MLFWITRAMLFWMRKRLKNKESSLLIWYGIWCDFNEINEFGKTTEILKYLFSDVDVDYCEWWFLHARGCIAFHEDEAFDVRFFVFCFLGTLNELEILDCCFVAINLKREIESVSPAFPQPLHTYLTFARCYSIQFRNIFYTRYAWMRCSVE